MLVLSRKAGEGIQVVGQDIEFIVLGVKGNRVRVGIKASDHHRIIRSELEGNEDDGMVPDDDPVPDQSIRPSVVDHGAVLRPGDVVGSEA